MEPFTIERPRDLAQAIAASSVTGAAIIAGGTELINWMKDGIVHPRHIIDITGLSELDYVRSTDDSLTIGALARMSDVARNGDVRDGFPAIAEALEAGASQQIRNMATMGGNLLQRTRCPYFRADTDLPCNKRRPGSGCAGIGGADRSLAIFGGSEHCIATHPSDLAVALAALDATLRVEGPQGSRAIRLIEFYRLPGDTPHVETVLTRGELIVEITVPRSPAARNSHYLKIRDRASYASAIVSAAVAIDRDGDLIREARIALGGVAPRPWRLSEVEANLAGVSVRDTTALRASLEPAFVDARAGQHNGFKIELAKRVAVRALQIAGGQA